jgi:stage II sporulation protein AA (anti-sigma F factor antagonist)
MVILRSTCENILIIELENLIDAKSRPDVEASMTTALASEDCAIVDLSRVSFVASDGLRMLLMLRKKQGSAHLLLCNMQDHVRDVFAISGLLPLFDVFPTREAAEHAARARRS